MTAARTYLSIGDVLTLLREEFPDVTISKIRFLESQGLVNPERSPSGYRKFFDTDVERLRWVLRQQREHFLPLKVIRDRLDAGDLGEEDAPPSEAVTHRNGRTPEPAHAAVGARAAGSVVGNDKAPGVGGVSPATATSPSAAPSHGQTVAQTQADDQAMARILADASRRANRAAESGDGRELQHAVPDPAAPAPPTHVVAPDSHVVASTPSVGADATGAAVDARSLTRSPAPSGPVAPTVAAPSHTSTRSPRHAPSTPDATAPAVYPAPPGPGPSPAAAADDGSSGNGGAAAGRTTVEGAAASARSSGGGRPGPGRLGAAAAKAAEVGAGGAGGAAAKAAGSQSTRNAAAPTPAGSAPAQAPAADVAPAAAAAGAAASFSITTSTVTGASLTAEELCAASGLSEGELSNLQSYGLIEPVILAGIPTFDEDALTVANLAASFRKYGIEARHLRPYRNAVDREVGLIEQVIIPLLRQRNPESRQRAVEAADELGALGQTMRATLMRAALRRHVGG